MTSATDMDGVNVRLFSWNPYRARRFERGPRLVRRRVNNFGDLLGPLIVQGVAMLRGVDLAQPLASATLMSIGSVLHLAPRDAVVWGSGVNGKMLHRMPAQPVLDVRAVRGPRTRRLLLDRGLDVPAVYGDPALLLPLIRPDLVGRPPRFDVTVIPNLNDIGLYARPFLDPRTRLSVVLEQIAASRLVVGSSLHGVIVAEALGIPARVVTSSHEDSFKYADYYEGSGRSGYQPASSVDEALVMGGESLPDYDPCPLLAAFPADLWVSDA